MTQAEYARRSGITRQAVSKMVAAGMPLTSADAADRWRGLRAGSRSKRPPEAKQKPEPAPPEDPAEVEEPPSPGDDTPDGAYRRQAQVERQLHRELQAAIRERSRDLRSLLVAHTSAVAGLASARKAVLDLAEREKALVSGEWTRKVMLEHDGAVATLIRAMPKQLAGRIAPHDPEHAERELDRWVQEVALATLHTTNPWKE